MIMKSSTLIQTPVTRSSRRYSASNGGWALNNDLQGYGLGWTRTTMECYVKMLNCNVKRKIEWFWVPLICLVIILLM